MKQLEPRLWSLLMPCSCVYLGFPLSAGHADLLWSICPGAVPHVDLQNSPRVCGG